MEVTVALLPLPDAKTPPAVDSAKSPAATFELVQPITIELPVIAPGSMPSRLDDTSQLKAVVLRTEIVATFCEIYNSVRTRHPHPHPHSLTGLCVCVCV